MPYVIQPGDTLNRIAARFGVSLKELLAANPGKWPNPNLIFPNQTVTLPSDLVTNPPPAQQAPAQQAPTQQTPTATARPAPAAPTTNPLSWQFIVQRVRSQMETSLSDAEIVQLARSRIDPRLLSTGTWMATEEIFGGVRNPGTGPTYSQPPGENSGTQFPSAEEADQAVQPPPDMTDPGNQPPPDPPPAQDAPPPEPPRTDFELESSRAFINRILARYGLEELAGWAWSQIQNFIPDDKILLELRNQDAYKRRFPGMQTRFDAGLNALTEEEYMRLENQYGQIMRAAGLPRNFYDQLSDFTTFITNDVSPLELNTRIDEGYRRVAQTAPEVRAAFQEFFGVAGDGALAAMFLDPDRAQNVLIEQARTAEVAGLGRRAGVAIGQGQATEIAQTAPSVAQIQAGIGQVSSQAPLARETFSEYMDLTTGDLVAAAFNTTGATEAREEIRRRRNQRLAQFSGGGGAAYFSGRGFVGLGVAGS